MKLLLSPDQEDFQKLYKPDLMNLFHNYAKEMTEFIDWFHPFTRRGLGTVNISLITPLKNS
jgi:hypothetical protein